MKTKIALAMVSVAVLIVGVVGWVYAYQRLEALRVASQQIAAQQDSLNEAGVSAAALQTLLAENRQDLEVTTAKLEEARVSLKEARTDLSKARTEAARAERLLYCPDRSKFPAPSFEDNMSVSLALRDYIESLGFRVDAAYWNTVWTGELFSRHTIEEQHPDFTYLWTFMVYFESDTVGLGSNESAGHTNGIFHLDDQCWLYLH